MAKQGKQKSMEETLWDSANKLRGTVESSEYKNVVLALIFLKFKISRLIFYSNKYSKDMTKVEVEKEVAG